MTTFAAANRGMLVDERDHGRGGADTPPGRRPTRREVLRAAAYRCR
ncbi:MAG: hypothetical protein J0I11_13605 [Actinobacteria bacterium]|nr:hypothetical protein [Actinomycetota bacterium]